MEQMFATQKVIHNMLLVLLLVHTHLYTLCCHSFVAPIPIPIPIPTTCTDTCAQLLTLTEQKSKICLSNSLSEQQAECLGDMLLSYCRFCVLSEDLESCLPRSQPRLPACVPSPHSQPQFALCCVTLFFAFFHPYATLLLGVFTLQP